jgi:flagellar motility protein MotE (MotC chaperone)
MACIHHQLVGNDRKDVILELLRLSSDETRRHVPKSGDSALSTIVHYARAFTLQPWHKHVIAELLRAGAPVPPEYASFVLPIAAALMRRQEEQLAALEPWRRVSGWREHDEVVGYVFDRQHASEEEQEVARVEEQVRELERQVEAQRREREEHEQRLAAQRREGEGGGR